MFRIRLVLRRTDDCWVFRVGRGFRVLNLLTAAALLAAGFWLESLAVPVLMASMAALGALYEESVRFDRAANRVEFRLGLLVFHRTRAFTLDDVAEVRTTTFGTAPFTGLEVGLRDGTALTIENDRGKTGSERLKAWGDELAAWLGVPLQS